MAYESFDTDEVESFSPIDPRTYAIFIGSKKIIGDLKLNGSALVSEHDVNEYTFDKEGDVTLVCYDTNGSESYRVVYRNPVFSFMGYSTNELCPGYYFVLRELNQEELWRLTVEAKLDYICMMTELDFDIAL